MTTVDADVIMQAIAAIATLEPLFRTQPELEQYMAAIERIAGEVGAKVPWGQPGQA
jgi:hypothetical protein